MSANPSQLPGIITGCCLGCVKPTFYGFPYALLSKGFLRIRAVVLYACLLELLFAIASLPLGAMRGGISKVSTGINLILALAGLFGVIGAVRIDGFFAIMHCFFVFGLLFLFLGYIALIIAVGKGDTDESEWVLVAVFAFCAVDLIVGCCTGGFACAVRKEYVRLRNLPASAIQAAAPGSSTTVQAGVPVARGAARGAGAGSGSSTQMTAVSSSGRSGAGGSSSQGKIASALGGQSDGKASNRNVPAAALAGAAPAASGAPGTECVVCLDAPRDAVLYRCGHNVMCVSCGQSLKARGRNCPICRAPIEDVVRRYG